ncbi:MAG: ComF family protein [Bacteroidia bacterium]|nr:ComF family protein [Bacteroidia bacterium]
MACHSVLNDNEVHFCTGCRHEFPVMNLDREGRSIIEKVFRGRIDLKSAVALLRFEKKGIVQQLLHNLKYKGQEEIGTALGKWLGSELQGDNGFTTVDVVLPVPVHKSKLKKRGYNQVDSFGRQLAQKLNAEYLDDILIKTSATATKVFQRRFKRWQNNHEVFELNNAERLVGKNILLVDDIVTTGATIEQCAQVLNSVQDAKLCVAAMAIAE